MDRRHFVKNSAILGAGALLPLGAAAQAPYGTVHELTGRLMLNGRPLGRNSIIQPGQTVTTGSDGHIWFTVAGDSFFLRPNTELRLSPSETQRLQQILAEEFRASTPEMVSGIADVYAGLTEPQLRELVAFLRSPSGRAFVDMQNSAQSALDQLGERVGEQVGLRALQRLEQERASK